MAKNKKKKDGFNREAFKKTGEDLQQWLIFTRKGSKVESGKRYNRNAEKRATRNETNF
jgi:hypothetical protein